MGKPAIRPVAWNPPKNTAAMPPVNLPSLTVIPVPGSGPEDVLWIGDELLTGLEDGRIIRSSLDGWQISVVADTGGRPLGLERHPDGRVVVCDAVKGLLLLDLDSGSVQTLVAAGEYDLRVCNNAAVAADGTIFFTDSSQHFDLDHWTADLLEHSGTGRLLRRDPDGAVEVLASGLQFANGVALSGDFVVVAQTAEYCLHRIPTGGGRLEPFVLNLPAFPDNLATDDDGLIWVAMASARKAALDGLPARVPVLRRLIWAMPEALHPKPDTLVWVRSYDGDGSLVHEFFGEHEQFYMVTGMRVRGRQVAMGSLNTSALAVFDLPG